MPRNQAAQKPAAAPRPAPVKDAQVKKVTPVRSQRHAVESSEQRVGQDHPRAMRSRGPARQSLEPARIEVVDRVVSQDKLDALAFNEEVLTILVHDSTNPIDDPIPEVWNDGVPQRFERNVEMQVKRKYVEVLARAKKTTFSQEKRKDGNGDDTYVQIPHSALKYPFVVVNDPNPKGRAWLKGILAEA